MLSRVSAAETSRLLRSERTAALTERLKSGDFDAARLESTPRRRAEVLAQVLTRTLSRGEMRRRLKRLELPRGWEHASLEAVSVEGAGYRLRRGTEGLWRSGPGTHAALLTAFPELLPHTLTNLSVQVSAAAGDTILTVTAAATSGSIAMSLNMDLYPPQYLGTFAEARYNITAGSTGMPPAEIGVVTTSDPYGSGTTGPGLYSNLPLTFEWSAAGLNWLEINAGMGDRSPGDKSASFSIISGSTWTVQADFLWVTVTYTVPPCDTCELTIQVNSACDAEPVGGGVLLLDNGMSCTQNGSGVCTISGIPDGEYEWTWTKTGYVSQSGTYTCPCEGGSSDLFLDVTPTGGCGGPCNGHFVATACEGPLEGAQVFVDGVFACETGADGTCDAYGFAAGSHTVTVTKDGYTSDPFSWVCS